MTKKAAKKSTRRRKAPGSKKNTGASLAQQQQQQATGDAAHDVASQRFVGDPLVCGEAAESDSQGKVPLHATHVIKGKKSDGTADVKRIRFKAF